jgi:predicted DNA-binding transcriptional regulator AlpA
MDVEKLLNVNELAHILGRSPETIKKDMLRNSAAVPPRVQLPHTRLLRWRVADVDVWLASHVMSGIRDGKAR